jgi:retron-type reverse transcriptase
VFTLEKNWCSRLGKIRKADIKGFFDNMNHPWLMRMLKQRINDAALLNLINQWLKARIKVPEGQYHKPQTGTVVVKLTCYQLINSIFFSNGSTCLSNVE